MELRNYTPHDPLTYLRDGHDDLVLPQSGLARCREEIEADGAFDEAGEFLRSVMSYGSVSGLPDPEPGVLFLVSQLVVTACPQRPDLAFPAGLVRDRQGTIIGFRLLARPSAARS